MHYKNGREAHNGDRIVYMSYGKVYVGILYDAVPGNDYCNGNIVVVSPPSTGVSLKDCLHIDDAWIDFTKMPKSPEGRALIMGAIYNFAGKLSCDESLTVGATHDAAAVADRVKKWAEQFGLEDVEPNHDAFKKAEA